MIGIRITQANLQVGFILNMLILKGSVAFMKYYVCKKGAKTLIPITALYNVVCIVIIIIAAVDKQKEARYIAFVFICAIIILNFTLFYLFKNLLSYVIFKDKEVRCKFMNLDRRIIPYDEITEYGIFFDRQIKFIFISRMELTEFQKEEKMFQLYQKTKNVIVLEYNNEVMQFLINTNIMH
jgi:hypothetical protein